MRTTINFAQYGNLESGQAWANCQTCEDFRSDLQVAGAQVAKMSVDTANDNAVAKALVKALVEAQSPIAVDADIGMSVKKGQPVAILKSFQLLSKAQPPKN
ncbi:hypothetical protein [Vibrio parahaemolyticus]|uniref:hypothetical protein n=1 Tax=Vibrio parahaemolyticus TaxID=670 RepID=UPI00215BF95D|nr:hypothetical protein [Vibrio parahaemolyticus]MCR9692912.1 hypothetical protein [Vibrio parahaemolyticus]MCR9760906.1 hypothetical protein [Vibrio parahaemolyticus]